MASPPVLEKKVYTAGERRAFHRARADLCGHPACTNKAHRCRCMCTNLCPEHKNLGHFSLGDPLPRRDWCYAAQHIETGEDDEIHVSKRTRWMYDCERCGIVCPPHASKCINDGHGQLNLIVSDTRCEVGMDVMRELNL